MREHLSVGREPACSSFAAEGSGVDFGTWSGSDYAAWWGATVATLAFAWNVVRALRAGPRIHVRANAGMQVYPRSEVFGDKEYIMVKAVSRGTGPTTVTHFLGFHSKSRWDAWRRKGRHFVVGTHPIVGPLPRVLLPGEEWQGMSDQTDMPEHYSRSGYLYMGVAHNQRRRSVYTRVRSVLRYADDEVRTQRVLHLEPLSGRRP